MIIEINRIKQNQIFKSESLFFKEYKNIFTEQLVEYLSNVNICKHCIIDKHTIADNFYDAVFDPNEDCFNKHLCWLSNASSTTILFLCSLMNSMTKEFIDFKKTKGYKQSIELISILESLQNNFLSALSEEDKITFDISPYMPKDKEVSYLHNMYKLGRDMRFVVHTNIGTSPSKSAVLQIGQHSAVMKATDEQMTMISQHSNSFIIKESNDEKNLSIKTKILCAKSNTIIIKEIKELEIYPLLSRKFPRAGIIHASLVHIANEDEYITGNMLDISEGGMGIVSSSKSHFEKGQDIVAFVSYEDEKSGLKFSFEANGIICSIIGNEHAFRYGIQLNLGSEEKEVIHNLVNILNGINESH